MLYEKLELYSKSGIYPFHMPGHKRNEIFGSSYLPLKYDITEITDFDNLHNAQGCIKSVEEKAARAYGVNSAFLLVNGSTGGILSAIRAMTHSGDKVLVARNCHKSVYNAVELCELNAEYILPNIDDDYGLFCSITPEAVNKALKNNTDIKLVVITSPTYEGVVSDIKAISEVCHRYNALLFVDEAHAAHFPFSTYFPDEAVNCGADAAVVSLHKTLPSLTQTALLITNNADLLTEFADNLSVFETSSPSYVLMSSIEKTIDFTLEKQFMFDDFSQRLNNFSEDCKKLVHISVLCFGNDNITEHSFYDFDKSKIIISTAKTNLCGVTLSRVLREKYEIELEMAYSNYAIAMSSVCDTDEGFERLYNALHEIDCELSFCKDCKKPMINNKPEKVFNSALRRSFKGKFVNLSEAVNMVSLEYLWAYPPGIPLLVAGERISEELIKYINYLAKNDVELYSKNKAAPQKIYVVDLD